VAIIPVLSPEELKHYHDGFLESFKTFPEYKDPSNSDTVFVMGSFGAFGNPSSFHTPIVRELRSLMMRVAFPLFRNVDSKEKRNLEQLFDRISLRLAGSKVSKESWHRDQAPLNDPTKETVYGGWINLDMKTDQFFSCVPNTHRDSRGTSLGFSKIPEQKEAEKLYRPLSKLYKIPPGNWIVFDQNIVHEVLSKRQAHASLRLYLGWRLTPFLTPLFDNKSVICDREARRT
jgi:hypothetical protein